MFEWQPLKRRSLALVQCSECVRPENSAMTAKVRDAPPPFGSLIAKVTPQLLCQSDREKELVT